MVPIIHIEGIPRWFTRSLHWWSVRECNKYEHDGPGVCGYCGQILDPNLATLTDVKFRLR